VLSVNPAELLGCATVTLSVGAPVPAALKERLAGETLMPVGAAVGGGAGVGVAAGVCAAAGVGVALGAAVAVGAVGCEVGDVVGEMAFTWGEGFDEPPPPQAASETATMPASVKITGERNLGLIERRTHQGVPYITYL
jgi:hypothetical protein